MSLSHHNSIILCFRKIADSITKESRMYFRMLRRGERGCVERFSYPSGAATPICNNPLYRNSLASCGLVVRCHAFQGKSTPCYPRQNHIRFLCQFSLALSQLSQNRKFQLYIVYNTLWSKRKSDIIVKSTK